MHPFRIFTINDLEKDWHGQVELRITQGDRLLDKSGEPVFIPAFGATTLTLPCALPSAKGKYRVEAVLKSPDGKEVKSIRELPVE